MLFESKYLLKPKVEQESARARARVCVCVLPKFLVGAAEAGCDIISFPSTTKCFRVKLITTSCSPPLIGRSRIPSRPRGQQIRSAAAIYWTTEAQRSSNTGKPPSLPAFLWIRSFASFICFSRNKNTKKEGKKTRKKIRTETETLLSSRLQFYLWPLEAPVQTEMLLLSSGELLEPSAPGQEDLPL